jgi:hypothetical protein
MVGADWLEPTFESPMSELMIFRERGQSTNAMLLSSLCHIEAG